jgi:hypothetical protein
VLIECPSCRHAIRIVDHRPGRFTPRCPKCETVFQLSVPDREDAPFTVSLVDVDVQAEETGVGQEDRPHVDLPKLEPRPFEWLAPSAKARPGRLPRGVPRFVGRYVLLRSLGHGRRGRTFLARPLWLGRLVVLKALAGDRASDRIFRALHTREAYTAAQLEHPNLAAMHELGSRHGLDYAVVEWTDGVSLAQVLDERHRIEPAQAAVLILQVARGLRAAHRQRLLHRDIKPDNLRVDDEGLVKVDDLGLEMTPSLAAALEESSKGSAGDPMAQRVPASVARSVHAARSPVIAAAGTPEFMAPEQARDPTSIDGRADIYALGGTFYKLVTGRPPFAGETAVELVRKHQEDPLVPPDEFVPGLPRQVSDVIGAMMGKQPDERYPNMSVVVDVLEKLVGAHERPAAERMEAAALAFHQTADALATSPARRLRFRVLVVIAVIWSLFVVFLAWLGLGSEAIAVLGAITALMVWVSSSVTQKSELLRLSLEVLWRERIAWTALGLAAIGVAALLWFFGGCSIFFLLLAAGVLAGSFHVFLDRPLAAERSRWDAESRMVLRQLRWQGHDEEAIRELIANEAGPNWDVLFERRFGPRATMAARARWHQDKRSWLRRPFCGLRELIICLLEKKRQQERDRRHFGILRATEEGRLEARGTNLLTARRKAIRIAKAMIVIAAEWRDEERLPGAQGLGTAPLGPPLMDRLNSAVEHPEPLLEPHETQPSAFSRSMNRLVDFLLGRTLRLLLGSWLLLILAVWLDASGLVTALQVQDQAAEISRVVRNAAEKRDPSLLREISWNIPLNWDRLEQPIETRILPRPLRGEVVATNLGVAGLGLLLSVFWGRRWSGLLALIAAFLTLFAARIGVVSSELSRTVSPQAQARLVGMLVFLLAALPRFKGRSREPLQDQELS